MSSACENSEETSTPEVFICPISRELMRDPVALADTGQIYDRSSIIEWFREGHNTCPLTGRYPLLITLHLTHCF